jgi:argininosuccinate synthase
MLNGATRFLLQYVQKRQASIGARSIGNGEVMAERITRQKQRHIYELSGYIWSVYRWPWQLPVSADINGNLKEVYKKI